MATLVMPAGFACPMPLTDAERIQLGHGSGGAMSAALLRERFLPHFHNPALDQLSDAAVVGIGASRIAVSTDTFVVSPLEFPGGNIGSLAVHGTLNDLAMMGARPVHLAAGFVLEEGLPLEVLDRVLAAMGAAVKDAGIQLVTGDTKVVERGKADGLFINTTGLGLCDPDYAPAPGAAKPGDAIIVSGPIGRHGIAIMSLREGLGFDAEVASDCATLWPLVERLGAVLGRELHVLRDPTRGGVASALNEIAAASNVGMRLEEAALPIPEPVAAACDMLGLDPLYVANEGILLAIVAPHETDVALAALRAHPLGAEARVIGRVTEQHRRLVVLDTPVGGSRIVDLLPGDQLPRIC